MHRSLSLSFVLFAMVHSAWAADATSSAANNASNDAPEIVVTTGPSNAVGSFSDSASEGVVKGAALQNKPLLRTGDVLQAVPGLVVTQHSGDGKANQYFLRGYNLDHGTDFATSVNGVPVNMPTNAHGQGYTDINFLIPELVSDITYRKGPYFADHGDFSSAGSADIHYKNSLDSNIYDLTLGAFGYRRNLVAGSIRLGADDASGLISARPTLLGALESVQNNGPWLVPEGLKKNNAFLRLSDGSHARGWSVDFSNYAASWTSTDQVPLELINSGQLARFGSMNPTDGGNTGRTILSAEQHDTDSSGYYKISAFAQHYRLQLWSDFTYYADNPDQGDQFGQAEQRNLFGFNLAQGWSQTLLGKDSSTEVGLQLRRDSIRVGLQSTQARMAYKQVSDDLVNQTQTGVYLQSSMQWSPWLRSTAGLRQSLISMNVQSFADVPNSAFASAQKTSPKLSLIFGPWQKTEWFINYGQGFHSNDARGAVATPPVPALAGSIGREVGIKTDIVSGLHSSLALWSLDSNSELTYAADAGTTQPKGASKRSGVEWNNHYEANQWLEMDANVAWTRARYAVMNDNNEAGDNIPNAVGKVATVRIATRDISPWSVGVETRYTSAYPLVQDGSLSAPSTTITNFRVKNKLSRRATVSVDWLNVFNRPYYDIAYGQNYQISPTTAPVPSGITVHPGEPRQLRATLSIKF